MRPDFLPDFAAIESRDLIGGDVDLVGGFIHVDAKISKTRWQPYIRLVQNGCSRLRRHQDRSLVRTCANAMKRQGSEQESEMAGQLHEA